MAQLLCNQSIVYIVQYIIFSIIYLFVLGIDLQMKILKHSWVHVLIMLIISVVVLQVLCHYKFTKTAWGLLIIGMIFNVLMVIVTFVDPKLKHKMEEDIKKKEAEKEKEN